MPPYIDWTHGVRAYLKKIPKADAERIGADVIRFAETEQGDVQRIGNSARFFQLRLQGYIVCFELLDEGEGIQVNDVFRGR